MISSIGRGRQARPGRGEQMPIYEYECPDCRERFEKLVRSSASADGVACPTCGRAARRLVSVFASIGFSTAGSSGSSSASCAPTGG